MRRKSDCFNPSVGILLVWTGHTRYKGLGIGQFQSLGRDSVGLDRACPRHLLDSITFQSLGRDSVGLDYQRQIQLDSYIEVSIPRSGFCWFGPYAWMFITPSVICFNPSVGILLVWTESSQSHGFRGCSFNPSVGILLVWTAYTVNQGPDDVLFQSLGRDSVGLD